MSTGHEIRRVKRRQVFYCMGYDPQGPAFYHAFFRHEFERTCNRFHLVGNVTARRDSADGLTSKWNIQLSDVDWSVETEYTFLRWDDLVKKDLRQPLRAIFLRKLSCDFDALVSGTILRLSWLNWRFGIAGIYPTIAIAALMILAVMGALLVAWGLSQMGVPVVLSLAAIPLPTIVLFRLGYQVLSKTCYLHLLVHDGIFSMDHARGRRHDYLRRVDDFATELISTIDPSCDEVVVVGHSSGSFCAVEVLARALRRNRSIPRKGPAISLVTVGANLPLIGCHPQAVSFRSDLALLAAEKEIFWVEYQDRLDLLSFAGFDPGRLLAQPPVGANQVNPIVYPAHVQGSMQPTTYRRERWNFWRLHFQYLMSVEQIVPCDYTMIVGGPAPLKLRGTDPEKAMQWCYGDGHWSLKAADLQPLVAWPPGRTHEREIVMMPEFEGIPPNVRSRKGVFAVRARSGLL